MIIEREARRMRSQARRLRWPVPVALTAIMLSAGLAWAADTRDGGKILGPNVCAECHKQEVEAWKGSHHFSTFREMPRNARAGDIAKRIGVRRVKSADTCLGCHFTVKQEDGTASPVAGISCESCHGAGQEWIRVHSGYSGKTAKTETSAEAAARWKLAESKGMIRPGTLYRLAKNCYGCHVVPQESLVNTGGHRAGSLFDLVSWSQGEVRHNTWHAKGADNVPASAARKRMLYLVGLGVELETAMRALATATVRKPFAFQMALRIDNAREQLAKAANAAPGVAELPAVLGHAREAALKLGNGRALTAAADSVAALVNKIAETYDGSTLAGLDALVPGPQAFKGRARKPGGVD